MLNRLFGARPAVPVIDVVTLAGERAAGKDVQVVDVREDDEWAAGHLADSLHIPLGTLPGRVKELDPNRPVVVICRSGNRSAMATEFLRHNGFQDVRNLTGGIIAWAEAGHPVTR